MLSLFLKNNIQCTSRGFVVHRLYSTGKSPVDLHHSVHVPPGSDGKQRAVVILHGGSKRNWGALSKALTTRLNRPVYSLDLRNHGSSPHATPMTYETMAEDVWHFIQQNRLSDVSLIGHSMRVSSTSWGGKVAMAMALSAGNEKPGDILSKMVVVDVSPIKGRISKQFVQYIDTMKEIESLGKKSRKEADAYLARIEEDPGVRAFLLTNLLPFNKDDPRVKFAVPLDVFKSYVPAIGDFPFQSGERSWAGKTLFVKGSRSAYIKESQIPQIMQFFPKSRFEQLDTSHWVHAEKPKEFMEIVCKFIEEN